MKTIDVIPNPYSAIDADGVPQGVVGLPGAIGAWIGAALDPVASRKTGKNRFYFPGPNTKRDEKGVAGLRVVTLKVANSAVLATVANAVREGSLIVVGKDDARKLGFSDKEFLEPEKALEREKQRAQELAGKDAKLADVPHEATPEDEDADENPTPGEVRVARNLKLQPATTRTEG